MISPDSNSGTVTMPAQGRKPSSAAAPMMRRAIGSRAGGGHPFLASLVVALEQRPLVEPVHDPLRASARRKSGCRGRGARRRAMTPGSASPSLASWPPASPRPAQASRARCRAGRGRRRAAGRIGGRLVDPLWTEPDLSPAICPGCCRDREPLRVCLRLCGAPCRQLASEALFLPLAPASTTAVGSPEQPCGHGGRACRR